MAVLPISEFSTPYSFVIYGPAGVGKTTIAATFPKPLLFMDINDKGLDSVRDAKDTFFTKVEHWDDIESNYWYLVKNPDEYESVALDTITQMQARCVEKVLEDHDKGIEDAGNWGSMTMSMWGDVATLMKSWIDRYVALDMNVIFLAQQRTFNMDEDSVENELAPEVGARLSPAIVAHLNAAVTVVGQAAIILNQEIKLVKVKNKKKKQEKIIEKIEYCLNLAPDPVHITKVRKPKARKIPELIINPTYTDLLNILEGE